MSLRIVQANVEQGGPLTGKLIEHIGQCAPDVVCTQEVLGDQLKRFADAWNMQYGFTPSRSIDPKLDETYHLSSWNDQIESRITQWGVAIFCRSSLQPKFFEYYLNGSKAEIARVDEYQAYRSVTGASLSLDGTPIDIMTTHFPAPRNKADPCTADPLQSKLVAVLHKKLKRHGRYVLTGDLNSKRGCEIYDTVRNGLIDHIPESLETTIDHQVHALGHKIDPIVVDLLASTSHFRTEHFKVIEGISDHKVLVADLSMQS